jgi:hypothetical protein
LRRLDLCRTVGDGPVRVGIDARLAGEVLSAAGTRVTAVTPKPGPGGELVEVDFVTHPTSDDDRLRGGTLFLDPNRGWLPVRKRALIQTKTATGTLTTEYDYGPGVAPQPRLTVSREEYSVPGKSEALQAKLTIQSEFHVPSRLPETREFTLSAFGLPEPVGVKWEKPTPRYLWYLAAAGGCGFFAALFGWLARRRRVPFPVSQPQVPT